MIPAQFEEVIEAGAKLLSIDELAREFLVKLSQNEKTGCGKFSLGSPDRKTDRARQKCRQMGFAFYQNGRWRITETGKVALALWTPSI